MRLDIPIPPIGLRHYVPTQYLWPILSILGSCFGCMLGLLYISTAAQDDLQRQRDLQSVEASLEMTSQMVVHDLQDYAKWDDAVRHIAAKFEPEWVDDNVAAYLGRTQGYTHVMVLDSRDRTIYAFQGNGNRPANAHAILGPSLNSALAKVRAMSPAGAPILGGVARAGDKIYSYSVAAVVPLTDKVLLPDGPTHIILIAQELNGSFIRKIEQQHHLQRLSLDLGDRQPAAEAVALRDLDGRRVGWMHWSPRLPGTVLRHQVLPGFISIAVLALIAAGVILRRGRNTIDALQRSEESAQHNANHDPLTGLPNRRAMVNRLRSTMDKGKQVSLLFMDLDGFKDANDVYGHAAGDELLRQAAARITDVVATASDAFVARAGGDEFAMALNDTSQAESDRIAAAILESFQQPFVLGDYSTAIGVSIGLAHCKAGEGGGEGELMRRADVAMYAAKAEGKKCFRRYEAGMDQDHDLRKRMEADLHCAVAQGEIVVVFQPIVDAVSGRTVSIEALSRWTHPVHGEVPPDVFIPLAEMSGLIGALGRHVLTRACLQALDWDVNVAVNLSPAQFWDRNMADEVRDVLAVTGFPAERLELEITESYLLRRPEAAALIIDELRNLGVRIALDDFGTGFASIGYLRRLSFDRIKIDKSFVAPLGRDVKAAELFASIVALGGALGLKVTAEGVETQDQADVVRLAGCDRIQGWLFGRPMAEDTMRTHLRRINGNAFD